MSDAGFQLVSLIQAHRAESLGPFLRRLARASVAAGAISLAACSGSHIDGDGGTDASAVNDANVNVDAGGSDSGPDPDAGRLDSGPGDSGPGDAGPGDGGPSDAGPDGGTVSWGELNCSDDGWQAVQGLALDISPDYLDAVDNSFGAPYVVDSIGTACETATDMDTCAAALAGTTPFGRYLRTTTGDTVESHQTEAEVLAVLGTIDTAEEAVLRVWQQGYTIQCDNLERGAVRWVDDHYEVRATRMVADCDPIVVNLYELQVDPDGTVTELSSVEIERTPGVCVGRRPEGLRDAPLPTDISVGAWLAETAFLEASAVHAFEVLADELMGLGAPSELVRDARAAAQDEVRHADTMKAVAARYGAETPAPEVEARAPRSRFAMAMDNATEGCVRETFGALLGHHQALAASDPQLRAAMATIAEDETRHATLSWRIAEWIEPQLTDAERSEVEAARREAVETLRAEMGQSGLPSIARTVGLPTPTEAVALVDRMQAAIWS
ncbi:MAG: ferritin-like domain-containing protein [Sandaracinaceae bacterium]